MKTLCCDVGSGSVRVAIIEYSDDGVLHTKPLAVSTEPLTIYNRQSNFYEQKSTEIWAAFCSCAQRCLQQAGIDLTINFVKDHFPIDAIAFSATCSLVIVQDQIEDNDEQYDVIMWMDHRATKEALEINRTGHQVLQQLGGTCSPEFSLAKLSWLYHNQPVRFKAAKAFMELPDWLTYRCSGTRNNPAAFPRSLCSVVCKWGYDAEANRWPDDLFQMIGIEWNETVHNQIGNLIVRPGTRSGSLSVIAAQEIGFNFSQGATASPSDTIMSVALSSSLIDAHAGVISMLVYGSKLLNTSCSQTSDAISDQYENMFCMISGTSTCHMVLNRTNLFTKGVWGPYRDAIIPGYYLREAGQSATGKLIEHIINTHYQGQLPSGGLAAAVASLNEQLRSNSFVHRTSLVMNPTFHGNRSPVANPRLKGAIYGFSLEQSSLLDLYVAAVEAIAYETKFIIEEIEHNNESIRNVIVTGGLAKNEFYLQLHADILGLELVTFTAGEADLMLVGASVIAFTSWKDNTSTSITTDDSTWMLALLNRLSTDSDAFEKSARVYKPRKITEEYHRKKYQCYRHLLDCCLKMEPLLDNINSGSYESVQE